jgi:hypothetical protein
MPANVAAQQDQYKKAYAAEHQGEEPQGDRILQIDTESDNAADEFRKQFYTKDQDPSALLTQAARRSAGFKVFKGQNLRQTPAGFRAAAPRSMSRLDREEAAMRVSSEKAKLERDVARLELARSRLEKARRHPQYAMRGRGLIEGCPEGTPGCDRLTSLGMRHTRQQIDDSEQKMMTAGDSMVPVEQAEVQRPRFIGRGLFN